VCVASAVQEGEAVAELEADCPDELKAAQAALVECQAALS